MTDDELLVMTWDALLRVQRGPGGRWTVEPLPTEADVRCFAVHPREPDTLLVGTQDRGVLRSRDAGRSWAPLGLAEQPVKALALSPREPDTVYAGTRPARLHRSDDGGATWRELAGFRRIPGRWWWFSPAEPPWQAYVQAIAVSPAESALVLAGIEFGAVVRSADGGASWSGHRAGALRDCHQLRFHASDGRYVYQAGGTGGGAAWSRDGGTTWEKAGRGLAKGYGVACAADALNPERWYVSVAPGPGKAYPPKGEAYLYRREPSGTWHPIGWAPHPLSSMPLALAAPGGREGVLVAGLANGDLWRTEDAGDTWERIPVNVGSGVRGVVG